MKKIFLIAISLLIIPLAAQQASGALSQYGTAVELELSPGESATFEWGFISTEPDTEMELQMGSYGWGSQFFSFPDVVTVPANERLNLDITVTIPDDHPGGVILGEDHLLRTTATLLGEEGGQTVINVRASRIIILTILPNENPEYLGNTAYDKPPEAEVTIAETVEEKPAEEKPTEPSGPLSIGGSPAAEEQTQEEGGGCLIATAAYGSEMAQQVQLLREIRDDKLLSTASGSSFMSGFNFLYYSFSPTIADLERENPMFREAVKITITPLLTSLSILNYVDMDSEEKVLGYGISLILLNAGMYFVAPAIVITKLRKRF